MATLPLVMEPPFGDIVLVRLLDLEKYYELHKKWSGWDTAKIVFSNFWLQHSLLKPLDEAQPTTITGRLIKHAVELGMMFNISVLPIVTSIASATECLVGAAPATSCTHTINHGKKPNREVLWFNARGPPFESVWKCEVTGLTVVIVS
jgi:hypothetical protein